MIVVLDDLASHAIPQGMRALAPATVRIGFCWAGSASYHRDWARSTMLAQWWPLIRLPGTEWVALITNERRAEADGAAVPNLHLPDLVDWEATAALLPTLDLVITVDTALAHLAGDAHRPTWLLLPTPSDWRWMEGRDDSPWYPTMRLYRQAHPGDWWDVFARARNDLMALMAQREAA